MTAMLLLLICGVQGFAQMVNLYTVGDTCQFEIAPVPGITYCWKVAEKPDFKKYTNIDKVRFLRGSDQSVVLLKWRSAGTFFLSVTGFNEIGCSNVKVYPVVVVEGHVPQAKNDYISAGLLKSVQIEVLNNDYDASGDLDTMSLRILSKPNFGCVTLIKNGILNYLPLGSKTGRDLFYYSICDLSKQCDTAMVVVDVKEPSLYLPEGISPNGDGLNDKFVIGGLASYQKSALTIFSREGVVVYRTDDYTNDWDGVPNVGRYRKGRVPSGTYYYILHLGGIGRVIKGFLFVAM